MIANLVPAFATAVVLAVGIAGFIAFFEWRYDYPRVRPIDDHATSWVHIPAWQTAEQLQLLLAQLDGRLASQRAEWEQVDRTATATLAASGVLLGLVVNNAAAFEGYPQPGSSVLATTLFVLAIGILAGVLTLWPRDFATSPEPEHLVGYAGVSPEMTIGTLMATKTETFKHNRSRIRWRLRFLRTQLLLLGTAGVLTVYLLWIGGL